MKTKKESREGFEIESELVGKVGKRTFRQAFPLKVNSLDTKDISLVVDFWKQHLKKSGDHRKLVVKNIWRVEKVPNSLKRP